MNNKISVTVDTEEDGSRLDRFLSRKYAGLSNVLIQKLCRKGAIRINGKKTEANQRVATDDEVMLPEPSTLEVKAPRKASPERRKISAEDEEFVKSLVIYKDENIIVINKPFGLAVQGGSKIGKHLDGLLDGLKFGKEERPKLVHRLDKDTSGVMVLARGLKAAKALTEGFRNRKMKKLYWAVVKGAPKPTEGGINKPIAGADEDGGSPSGNRAMTLFRTVNGASNKVTWLEMMPVTGRKHQLRIHAAAIGHPIVGDDKYGGKPEGLPVKDMLHLHARAIKIEVFSGRPIEIIAPLPSHMSETFEFFGFSEKDSPSSFAIFEE